MYLCLRAGRSAFICSHLLEVVEAAALRSNLLLRASSSDSSLLDVCWAAVCGGSESSRCGLGSSRSEREEDVLGR